MSSVNAKKTIRQRKLSPFVSACIFCESKRIIYVTGHDDVGEGLYLYCLGCETAGPRVRPSWQKKIDDSMYDEAARRWNAAHRRILAARAAARRQPIVTIKGPARPKRQNGVAAAHKVHRALPATMQNGQANGHSGHGVGA